MKIRQAIALSLFVFLCTQVLASETPEEVSKQYYAALKQDGWNAITDFAHPDEAERFRGMLLPVLETEKGRSIRESIFPGEGGASISSLSARDFLRRFILRYSALMEAVEIKRGQYVVLGSVKEGELAHVVVRSSNIVRDVPLETVDLLSLKPSKSGWAILLPPEIEGLAQGMRKLK